MHSERQQNKEDSLKSAPKQVKLAGISLLSWPNTPKEKGKILDFLWIFKGRNTPLSTSPKTAPFKAEASEIVHCISILLPAFIWEDVSIANKDGERKKIKKKIKRRGKKERRGLVITAINLHRTKSIILDMLRMSEQREERKGGMSSKENQRKGKQIKCEFLQEGLG